MWQLAVDTAQLMLAVPTMCGNVQAVIALGHSCHQTWTWPVHGTAAPVQQQSADYAHLSLSLNTSMDVL